jgi:indole-3-acetate monooxygenase
METDVISRSIADLAPAIRARRDEIEEGRRMPRDLVDDLCETGIFSMSVPRAVGGKEAAPVDTMRAIETVAAADGSAGWCAMIGVGCNIAAGYMSEAGAREVIADPERPWPESPPRWAGPFGSTAECV